MSNFQRVQVDGLHDFVTGALVGFVGADGREYMLPVAAATPTGTPGLTTGMTGMALTSASAVAAATPGTTLTNPLIQATGNVNNFTQAAIQNRNAGISSSSDHIAYPDNNANDLTGFADMGMTSSVFADAAYTVTGPNEAYLFGSAPASSGKTGDLVLATDSTGTSNAIRFYVNGFNKAVGNFAAKILTTGLFTFGFGRALVGSSKVVVNNGATTTYTVPAGASYVNITTSAASLAFTFPAAAAAIDGLEVTINPSASVATATWASTGATFVGAPAALTANTSVKFIYDHATTKWYQN